MQHFLVTLVVCSVLTLVYKYAIKSNSSPEWPDGMVAYGPLFRYFVYFFWLCLAGFLVLGIMEGPDSQRELIAAICVFLLFGALVLVMHLEFFIVSIKFDGDEIHTKSPWRSSRRIPWRDVTGIEYSQSYQWYEVKTQNHGIIRCHVYLGGLRKFLVELEKRGYNPTGAHPYAK